MNQLNSQYDVNDNVYVNVVFRGSNNTESAKLAEVNETKTQPILGDCSQYYCSIIKFDIPLSLIPIMVMPINALLGPNNTTFNIGITFGSNNYVQNIIYVPDNNLSPGQEFYYFVYNYQNLIKAINVALQAAYIAAGSPGGAGAPYIYLESATQLLHFVIPNAFLTSGATIFWNDDLDSYLDSFPVYFFGFNNSGGKDYRYSPSITPNYGVPITNPVYYDFPQEYPTLEYWSSLRKILITTNNIPILNEFTPGANDQQGIVNSIPIITDFTPSIQQAQDARSIAYYTPAAQYRLVDMLSTRPLQNIDLKIQWQDKHGNIYPLYIATNQEANVKLAFFKKSLYKHSNLLIK